MAKRVYELAKEIGVDNASLMKFLTDNNVEVRSHMSTLEDSTIAMVRSDFKRPAVKPAPAKAEDKTAAEGEKVVERPKKKASITAVFNPQNSKNMKDRKPPQKRPAGERPTRPAGERPVRPAGERPVRPAGERPTRPAGERPVRPAGERPVRPAGERPARPAGERPARPAGERPARPAGERPARPAGERPVRPASERPQENRPARPVDNRPNRGEGIEKNNERSERNDRRDRKDNQNNRGGSGYNQGDRGNNRFGGNRQKESGGQRFDRELNKFNKDSAKTAVPDEVRAKESRDNNRKKNNNNNNNSNKDYDKLGSRKQERFVNLEKQTGHKKRNAVPQQPAAKDDETIKQITLPEHMTIKELADRMKVQASVLIKKLFMKGQMVTVNNDISYEEAEEIALEFNFIAEPEEKVDVIAELLKEDEEDTEKMVPRPPVVCVMGHVDHGKTSLLDAIRHTKVTDKEAGGITQAIGAYIVTANGQKITFLDTPGHEAFTAMRMRGANSTDIAILVVAADDGVMPQTVEAINHAKAAGVEIIVAVNKIDKPAANIDKVKQELSEYELIPEDWGGSTIFCPVSAHTKEGIDNLLDMILLTAEVMELKANPKRNARGLVIEAQLDKGRGAVATVLVQKGTLKVGQPIACGSSYGKVRAMIDDNGRRVKEAGPSTPVEILGLNNVPDAGETFVAMESEKEAKAFAETYISESKNKLIEETKTKMSLDDLFSQIQSGNVKELNIIVKADVQGSVEAVKQSLVKLSNDEVVVKVIHGGVGAINESDVILASASNAIIIGFNVRPDPMAKSTAEREGVDVRLYKVIYNAIEDVEAAMKGMLDPIFEEKIIGHAEVRQIFKASGVGNIAGSYILDGVFERGCKVRVKREGEQIFEGDLASLKRFKDDVKEVKTGYECGLVLDGFNDIQELDIIEAYKMVEVPR
ncbi:MAG: translation initiation factor IF-2 [Lachnospiraceae bacterium]|nr:translation initiation factor IF-2 [bacterium]MDY5518362.1 translation initiation factor IF-2 [Lachnospiraceae bacterium]